MSVANHGHDYMYDPLHAVGVEIDTKQCQKSASRD